MDKQLLGVEVEHFCIDDNGAPLPFEVARDILEEWGLEALSLEPSAQLEVSLPPFERVSDVEHAYRAFRAEADERLVRQGYRIHESGCHPTQSLRDLELIPSRRYRIMSAYFDRIGSKNGRLSMCSTASVHVSLDYRDEADAVRKMRVASVMAPVLGAICDNSPSFEGLPNSEPLRRLALWLDVDDTRCGTVPTVFHTDFGFEQYADWVLAAPRMFPHDRRPAYDLLWDVWPYARLKNVVEVRAADCMPTELIMGYVALIKGLFYNEGSLAAIEYMLGVEDGVWPLTPLSVRSAFMQIRRFGHDGMVYGFRLATWERLLFSLARGALDAEEAAYLGPLERFAAIKPWWRVG